MNADKRRLRFMEKWEILLIGEENSKAKGKILDSYFRRNDPLINHPILFVFNQPKEYT